MKSRNQLLQELAAFKTPAQPIREQLKQYGWDSQEEHFTLQKKHLLTILDRYLSGELSTNQVEEWAECFEGRDDTAFESKQLSNIIYQLANPILTGPITKDLVTTIRRNLTTRSS